jgi:hypothetical protein
MLHDIFLTSFKIPFSYSSYSNKFLICMVAMLLLIEVGKNRALKGIPLPSFMINLLLQKLSGVTELGNRITHSIFFWKEYFYLDKL